MAYAAGYLDYFSVLEVRIKGKTVDIPDRTRYVMVADNVETLDFVKENMKSFIDNVVNMHRQEVKFASSIQRKGSVSSQPW